VAILNTPYSYSADRFVPFFSSEAMSLSDLALRVLRAFKFFLESGHNSIQDTARARRHYAEQRTT
jgi:hypothetical protein